MPGIAAGQVHPPWIVRAVGPGGRGEQHVRAGREVDERLAGTGVARVDQRPALVAHPQRVRLTRVFDQCGTHLDIPDPRRAGEGPEVVHVGQVGAGPFLGIGGVGGDQPVGELRGSVHGQQPARRAAGAITAVHGHRRDVGAVVGVQVGQNQRVEVERVEITLERAETAVAEIEYHTDLSGADQISGGGRGRTGNAAGAA